ncbi:MAG: SdpI family protein [Steroidobacteraceae bacterium]
MSNAQQRGWFRKKDVGFGWGEPACWKGWISLLAYMISMALGLPLLGPKFGRHGQLLVAGVLTAALLTVVVLKAEPLWDSQKKRSESSDSGRRLDSYTISSYFIVGLLIAFSIPLAFGFVPQNASYGFRIPSTLSGTSAHWYHVNQVAGVAGIAAGVISIAITTVIARRVSASASWRGPVMLLLALATILAASVPPFLVK